MMYWNGDWNGWAWAVMLISMLAFWALVALGIWLAVRSSSAPPERSRSAEETLRQRYAAGELDDEEFARRLEVLREGSMTRS